MELRESAVHALTRARNLSFLEVHGRFAGRNAVLTAFGVAFGEVKTIQMVEDPLCHELKHELEALETCLEARRSRCLLALFTSWSHGMRTANSYANRASQDADAVLGDGQM